MTSAYEAVSFSNIAASTAAFPLTLGGRYSVSVIATFGGGSVKLQKLGPDGSTFLDIQSPFNNAGTEVDLVISTFSANGTKDFVLAPGEYKFVIATATAVYISLARCPQ